jgi:hypothetical protein
MTHTPGPWVVSNDTIGSDHGDIARIHYQSSRTARGWEDRFVIAAAPEMLAALKEIVAYDEGSNDPEDYGYEVLVRCKTAIAKAEGRE